MGRLDWKKGRWSADQETDRILKGMRGWRDVSGDWLDYYRLNSAATVIDNIYDEATGEGRIYLPPVRVPCLHVTHIEGDNENTDMGFYYNDTLTATIAFDQFTGVGMDYADIRNGNYINDRVYYDQKIFRILSLSIRGQIQQRDIIVGLDATQMKPDELVDDQLFAQWSQGATPNVANGTAVPSSSSLAYQQAYTNQPISVNFTSSEIWTVDYSGVFSYMPTVIAVDGSGSQIFGQVQYGASTVTVSFGEPVTGTMELH